MSSTATIESPSKSSTTNLRYHTNGLDIDSTTTTTTTNGNGVTAVVVTNPLASSSFSSTSSRYQSSVMNKYKNLATPDLTHPLTSLKQMTHVLTNNNGNNSALDPHAYLASKYVRKKKKKTIWSLAERFYYLDVMPFTLIYKTIKKKKRAEIIDLWFTYNWEFLIEKNNYWLLIIFVFV